MTNYCKENTGMVIHTDSFANERRFVYILKCRRTRQTGRVVLWWSRVSYGCYHPATHPSPPKKDDDNISSRFHIPD